MKLLSSARKLKGREETPAPFADPYSDMTPDEKSKMIIALMAAREQDAERIRRDETRIDELLSKVDELLSLQKAAMAAEKERDDYKRLAGNLGSSLPQSGEASARGEDVETKSKDVRLYRQGLSYRTMSADNMVCHNSDIIYCYEDGSRGRDALKYILGDSQVKALQSDGYNVYMYLDDHVVDMEHLCCMAHARAKFKYALEQGDDKDAAFILELIGELYKLEWEYDEGRLSPRQIRLCRNSLKTKEIIIKLRSKLDVLLSDGHPPRGELMEKAINYMDTFWTQLFAYLNDGSYSIDNSIAERFIRPLVGERKNSLFFGSDRMARVSAVYHTIISTCKMQGVSVLAYFKKFFSEIVKGRRDYEHLLLLTIGLN